MLNSVWTAALSVALGSGPMAHPAQPVQLPQPQQAAAQQAAPRILQPGNAAPIPPQYYQYPQVAPAHYYTRMPMAPQWQYGYPAPQHQLFTPHPGYGIVQVGAEVPAPAPPAEMEVSEETAEVAAPTKEPALNEYLQEISSYVGPGFRTYSYKQVSTSSDSDAGAEVEGEHAILSAEEELRLHLTKVGASAYAAELAKLRARHDYEQLKQIAAPATHHTVPPAPAPLAIHQTRPVPPAPQSQVAPANFQPPSRLEQMKQQLEQQTLRLQALQGVVSKQQSQPQAQATRQQPQQSKPARRGLLYQIFDR